MTAPENPIAGSAINDAHASAERIASVVQDVETRFRQRLSAELREPLRQTRRFAETLGARLDSTEIRASLNVLHGFLEATRRLISQPDRQDVSVHAAHTEEAQSQADAEDVTHPRQTPNPPHFPTESGLNGEIRQPNFLQ